MRTTLASLPILLATACSVGEYGVSMNMGGDSGGGDDRNKCVDKGTPGAAHMHAASGANPAGARSGLGCMAAGGCHGAQPGSSQFYAAGTA